MAAPSGTGAQDSQQPRAGVASLALGRGVTTTAAMALRLGDRFVVEPGDGDDFVATLTGHHGWGLVHGQIDLAARRDDGGEFLYSIHYQAPVRVIPPRGGDDAQ